MSLKYVYQSDRSELQRDPLASGEVIKEGEFVVRNGDGELAQFDPANDDLPNGIVVHHEGPLSDALVEHDEDYVQYSELGTFRGDDGDRAYYMPLTPGDQIMPQTVKDGQGLNEPVVDDGTVVAVTTDGSGETRLVESGNGSVTNAVDIGRIYQQPNHTRLENNYDQRVPVQLDADIFHV